MAKSATGQDASVEDLPLSPSSHVHASLPSLPTPSSASSSSPVPRQHSKALTSRIMVILFLCFLSLLLMAQSERAAFYAMRIIEDPAIILQDMAALPDQNGVDDEEGESEESPLPRTLIVASTHPRPVAFLKPKDWIKPHKEAYSGMWWQERRHFLSIEWVGFKQLESASFKAFRNGRARKTRDWLDFSVTHLSVFWKHFHRLQDERDTIAFRSIEEHLDAYFAETQPLPIVEGSPAPVSIAVLPFFAPAPDAEHVLPEKALLATLASLWQIGIGRCVVVVGGRPEVDEEKMVQLVFDGLQSKLQQRQMQLQVVQVPNLTQQQRKFMPEVALRGLQLAMRGNYTITETQRWLGDSSAVHDTTNATFNNNHTTTTAAMTTWEYVYFTEPDLILHARPSALPAVAEQMQRGRVVSAHRFQPIPHEHNFPGYDRLEKVIPGNMSVLMEMDPLNEDEACCDAGKLYLSNAAKNPNQYVPNNKACSSTGEYWWACGFRHKNKDYRDLDTARDLHNYIKDYPLIKLKGGTGFPLLDLHQRTCIYERGHNCIKYEDPVNGDA